MQKADVGSLIGVVSTTVLSALSFIYNLGVFQFLFPYLVGAFTTYFVQHRLQMGTEKRERKRENYEGKNLWTYASIRQP